LVQKNEQNQDLRVLRTRKALQTAMIELTIEKGFSALTVRDIAKRAMVNRTTFYRHYLDKYDLLDQYMEGIYQMLESSEEPELMVEKLAAEDNEPLERLVEMFQQVQERAEFFRMMLGPKGDSRFTQKIREYVEKRLRRLLPQELPANIPNAPPLDMVLKYVSSASVGTLHWWLENDTAHSAEQMAIWVVQLNKADFGITLSD